jgi:methyl-accepting chemotaxis protein
MSLIKTGELTEPAVRLNGHLNVKAGRIQLPSPPKLNASVGEPQRRKQRTFARQQKAAERVASATTQVASGIAEAASACDELRKAMEQIATGAEEAASAAEQSQRAMTRIGASNRTASDAADVSVRKTEALQGVLSNVNGQILASIGSVGRAAERQAASVQMMDALDKQAANIGDIV